MQRLREGAGGRDGEGAGAEVLRIDIGVQRPRGAKERKGSGPTLEANCLDGCQPGP